MDSIVMCDFQRVDDGILTDSESSKVSAILCQKRHFIVCRILCVCVFSEFDAQGLRFSEFYMVLCPLVI